MRIIPINNPPFTNNKTKIRQIVERINPQMISETGYNYLTGNLSFEVFRNCSLSYIPRTSNANLHKTEINENITLSNNINVNINASENNLNTTMILHLIPNETLNVETLPVEMLSYMLDSETDKYNTQSSEINIGHSYNRLRVILKNEREDADKLFENLIKAIYAPNLTQEKLNSAKENIKAQIASHSSSPELRATDYLYYGNKAINFNNVEQITLNDIQKLHKDMLANSQLQVAITIPKKEYETKKNTILSSLAKLPKMQIRNKNTASKEMKLIEEDIIIQNNTPSGLIQFSYVYMTQNNGNLKEQAAERLLYRALINTLYAETSRSNGKFNLIADKTNNATINYMQFGLGDKKKYKNTIEDMKNQISKAMQKLSDGNIPYSSIKELKDEEKKDIVSKYDDQFTKTDIMINLYNSVDLDNYLKILDGITSKDIQNAAKKIFGQPKIIAISN